MGQLNGHEPLVFRGPMLSLSSVRKLGGRASVVVKDQQHASFGRTTFAELVDGVRDERLVWYFAQQPVPPAVAPALPGCPVGRQPGLRQPNMWVGSAGAHTPLHHDYMHNVAMQLDGRKRFTLFAPSDTPYLARETNDARRVNYSQITRPREVNRKRFREYRRATPIEVELGPGEVLFLPAFWWHEVETLEPSLMLNWWWPPRLERLPPVDFETSVASAEAARALLIRYFNLAGFRSDHDVVGHLEARGQRRLAALVLGDLVEAQLARLGERRSGARLLLASTAMALLKATRVLRPRELQLLEQAFEMSTAASAFARATDFGYDVRRLNKQLEAIFTRHGVARCRRLLENNRVWLNDFTTDAYV